jgi:predicted dehydrogenase
MGWRHARQLAGMPEVQVVALGGIVKSKCERFRKEVFGPRGGALSIYTDFEKMLAGESLDAVVLVTPHTLHYPHAKAALRAGLHVLREKLEHFDKTGDRVKYAYVPCPGAPPLRSFVNAILGNDTLRCPGRYGILLAELMDAIHESIEVRMPVEVRHRVKPAMPVPA